MTRAKGRRVMSDDTKDVEFFAVFDGTKGRPEGVYLDMQERAQAEVLRAKAEGRDPETDESKLPAAVGTVLVTKANQVDNSIYSNPPMNGLLEPKDVGPVSTLPVNTGGPDADVDLSLAAQFATERLAQDEVLMGQATNPDSEDSEDSEGSESEQTTGNDNDSGSVDDLLNASQ